MTKSLFDSHRLPCAVWDLSVGCVSVLCFCSSAKKQKSLSPIFRDTTEHSHRKLEGKTVWVKKRTHSKPAASMYGLQSGNTTWPSGFSILHSKLYHENFNNREEFYSKKKKKNHRVDASHPDAKTNIIQDFPGGPVTKIPRSQCRRPGFDSWWGN